MENVTHSLIGVALGEGFSRATGKKGSDRAALLWASVLGSNLPDGDILMKPFVGGGSLGYLLHHRGYTHTLLLSLPLALLAATVGRWVGKRAPVSRASRASWGLLLLVGWVGVLCHIGADFWNDYGVHPFWPLAKGWYYGDFIFIVEPLFWLSLLPFVYRSAESRWARVVSCVLGAGMIALCCSGRYMSGPVTIWICLWAMGWVAVHLKRRSAVFAFAAIGSVLALFAIPRQLVRERVLRLLPPSEHLVQLSTTPAPSNPLCWRVIVSSRLDVPIGNPPVDYFAREGVMVFQPGGLGATGGFAANNPERCPPRVFGENNALTSEVSAPSLQQPGLKWAGEFRGNLQALRQIIETHCRVGALLRFVRMPYWLISKAGAVQVGDLRYHGGNGLGFADIESKVGEDCYSKEPDWVPPSALDYHTYNGS